MAAMLLLGITVFNGFIMVPLYTTGEPMPSDDYNLVDGMSNMNAATILNITGSSNKMIFAFICAIVVIPSFAFAMIYRFRQKYYHWKKRVDPMSEFSDIDMTSYTVEVTNLPIDEGVESLQRRITSNMIKLYPPDPITGKSVFVRARVIGDYNYLYKKSVELKQLIDELAYIRTKNSEPGAIRRQKRVKEGVRCWCCGTKVDEETYYIQKVESLKNTIRAELSRQRNQNTGYGFLLFADAQVVKDFKHLGKKHF